MFVADAHETHWVRKEMFGGWNKGERCGEDMEWHWELMQEEGKHRKTSRFKDFEVKSKLCSYLKHSKLD